MGPAFQNCNISLSFSPFFFLVLLVIAVIYATSSQTEPAELYE